MPTISHIDGGLRRVYLDPAAAVNGVITVHPVDDVYREYKSLRASDESVRPYRALLRAEGNVAKGNNKFTPRYCMLMEGTKLVIPAGVDEVRVTGELLTDDQSSPFDISLVTAACMIIYQPAEAEVIKVSASGNEYTLNQIADAVWTKMLEGQFTAAALQKLMASVLLGKVSGAGTGVESFRNLDDTVDRVISTTDAAGNRTDITLVP